MQRSSVAAINPCLQKVCHTHAACTHVGPNQHTCQCEAGYAGDGVVCMPVDPCQTQLGGCSSESTSCVYDGPGKVEQCVCVCLTSISAGASRQFKGRPLFTLLSQPLVLAGVAYSAIVCVCVCVCLKLAALHTGGC